MLDSAQREGKVISSFEHTLPHFFNHIRTNIFQQYIRKKTKNNHALCPLFCLLPEDNVWDLAVLVTKETLLQVS